MEGEKSGLKIWLFVEHGSGDTTHSMYFIEPFLKEQEIDSDGFIADSISPIISTQRHDSCFIHDSGMFRFGSRFYFFGGRGDAYLYKGTPKLSLGVQVLDLDNLNLGFRSVASLNAPKQTPCVFCVNGLVYALGSHVRGCNLEGSGRSGIFEKYDPGKDCWEVLPDPPKPFGEVLDINWCDCATVVRDRYVYVGNHVQELYLVFDLDVEQWTSLPRSSQFFPYGSVCVDDSLYYLTGIGSWKLGTQFDNYVFDEDDDDDEEEEEVRLVKRSPLACVDDPFRLLKSICLKPENEQVISTFTDLEHDTWFSPYNYSQWRDIFHLGGRFFCYVVTAHLVDLDYKKVHQPYCRGVWIKVFEEMVPDRNSTTKQPHFRNLASFSYKIRTPFHNNASFIRCSAFGSVPDSWVKAPLIKKKVAAKEREAFKAEQSQHAHGGGSEGLTNGYLLKMLTAREEENWRLRDELARKDALLKDYESFLAKCKGKLVLAD
ncbi:hypothetical protein POM88_038781 [Heracleum sosnowskyi]|uniref:F-box/kelch-repeat protein n=1 Tax=Heracleum sosnowskyi TaxID=360622 RepID=A0AAD8HBW5_9APIA|nr:hypothetical protein POM88_038781 [Heracleum sosnowskyi]